MIMKREINLEIQGLGIIMYSPFAVAHIKEGEDYLESNYMDAGQVVEHIYAGTIVGFCTGSPGDYIIKIKEGYPDDNEDFDHSLRLGIEIREKCMCFRDLYDLLDWTVDCDVTQKIEIADGFYHITVCTNLPESEIYGDNQVIYIYLNKLESMPKLKYNGVPQLCE